MAGPTLTDSTDRSHRGFVAWLLGSIAVATLAIGAFNWAVDPTGVTGRTTRWQVADNSAVRSAKLDLYDARLEADERPEVVLLGSSRTMKFNPATVERLTGARTFNAAVSGGTPNDAWLFTQLLEEQQDAGFPHLVWGLDVDAFREKRLRDGLATDPRMARFVPWTERVAIRVSSIGTLLELQTLEAALRSVRAGGPTGAGAELERFDEAGFQLWSRKLESRDVLRNRAIRRQTTNYANFVFERDGYTRVEDEPFEEFVNVVRAANERDVVPTIFLTPFHPIALDQLERNGLQARRREVLDRLRELQDDGDVRFELVDLTTIDTFDGDPREFYDGVHMTPANTDRVLELLNERGLLAPARSQPAEN
jgi:hypothetical protein